MLQGEIVLETNGHKYWLRYKKGCTFLESDECQVDITGFDEMQICSALGTVILNTLEKHNPEGEL